MYKEVIIVEGTHDESLLRKIYPDILVITTNGSEISKTCLETIKKANKLHGVILFLDPDFPGKKIRNTINDYIGECKHAYLEKHQCISKNGKKVGIEHASVTDIKNALNKALITKKESTDLLKNKDLIDIGIFGENSKQKRVKICSTLGIEYSNNKSLLKMLNMFEFTKEKIVEILENGE